MALTKSLFSLNKRSLFAKRFGLIFLAALLLCNMRCQLAVTSPQYAVYHSTHFTIYFLENEYTLSDLTQIGERKEHLYNYINKSLDVTFNGVIKTYLVVNDLWGFAAGAAAYNGVTCESWHYVMSDNGHEIIHEFVFAELGISNNSFLTEGIAVAHELDLYQPDPVERFVNWCTDRSIVPTFSISIANQMVNDSFEITYENYARAGAFIKFLETTFGLDDVKRLYKASITKGDDLGNEFNAIFGISIQEAEHRFYQKYFSLSPDQPNSGRELRL